MSVISFVSLRIILLKNFHHLFLILLFRVCRYQTYFIEHMTLLDTVIYNFPIAKQLLFSLPSKDKIQHNDREMYVPYLSHYYMLFYFIFSRKQSENEKLKSNAKAVEKQIQGVCLLTFIIIKCWERKEVKEVKQERSCYIILLFSFLTRTIQF